MGRAPCCDKANVKKGPWSPEEDAKLKAYIEQQGTGGNWIALPQKIGLKRCGKSCRLRWLNYLRPNLRHGGFSEEEDNIICSLYINIGSRWSIIAAQLPGRTDNDIKNYWNTRLKKKLLGKQRKEARRSATLHKHQHQHQQDQAVAAKGEMVIMDHDESFMAPSSGHGGVMMMMMNQTHQAPYWPHNHLLQPPPALPLQDQDQECPQDLIKNLLIKLGGRFSEEPNTTHLDPLQYHPIDHHTTSFNHDHQHHLYANDSNTNNNMVSAYDDQVNEYMLQQLENYPVELSDLVYGDEQQVEHGAVLDPTFSYGINDMINVSTTATGTSSSESSSTNWGTHDQLDFPPMSYEANCQQQQLQQQQQQNAIFQESSYFDHLQ